MNELEKVKKQMRDLLDCRQKQLEEIADRLDTLHGEAEAARRGMDEAAAALDETAFAKAEADIKSAETRIAMYESRRDQIVQQELIGEAESDAVIDGLLAYERTLEANFKAAIEPHLAALTEIRSDYVNEVMEVEQTISTWTNTIRRSYINRAGGTRTVNGKRTNRFDTPQAIHPGGYTGCKASGALGTLLDTVGEVLGND